MPVAPQVALRKESVDRNSGRKVFKQMNHMSLSARRAWIEIPGAPRHWRRLMVALRKESVDRNLKLACIAAREPASLSARRAWIEILISSVISRQTPAVALRKESVDRNTHTVPPSPSCSRSLSARRAWIEILTAFLTGCTRQGRSPQGERG